MKKPIKFIALLMVATIVLTSCDSNKKSSEKDKEDDTEQSDSLTIDAKKIAQIVCKVKELSKDGGYTKNADEIRKLSREAEDISNKYKKMYENMKISDKEELQKKLKRAYEDELKNCDN